jgi:SIR2-like domain
VGMEEEAAEIISVLQQAYRQKQLRIVTGALLSKLAEIPSPEELGERVASRIVRSLVKLEEGRLASLMGESLEQMVANAVANVGSEGVAIASKLLEEEHYHKLLAEELYQGRDAWQLPVTPLHFQLASLTEAELYTLNFDPLLELALMRVRDARVTSPGSDSSKWRARRGEWPRRPRQREARGLVHHLNGWIDPIESSPPEQTSRIRAGASVVLTGRDFVETFGNRLSPARKAVRNLLESSGTLLLLGIEAGSDAMRRLLSCLPDEPKEHRICAILTRTSSAPATWFQQQLLEAHGVDCVWTDKPEEAEMILREIKFGATPRGKLPPWVNKSLGWRQQQAPDSDIFGDEWQALAHAVLEALVVQIKTLFLPDTREKLDAAILIPVKGKESIRLQIVATSNKLRTGAEAKRLWPLFSLALEAGSEQGLSGLVFATGCAQDSSNSVGEAERNFTSEMKAVWYTDLGYKEWRSLLSVPVLDSVEWVPVSVISLSSNLAIPFWNSMNEANGATLADLLAAMRRTAKILISEYKESPQWKRATETRLVASDDSSLAVKQMLREIEGASLLTNYQGFVNVKREDQGAGRLTYRVGFSTTRPKGKGKHSVPINISKGLDSEEVIFRLELVSPTLGFRPSQTELRVPREGNSSEVTFECLKVSTERAIHRIFIQVFQKNRLIQVVRLEAALKGE